jgi:hypothetical protein
MRLNSSTAESLVLVIDTPPLPVASSMSETTYFPPANVALEKGPCKSLCNVCIGMSVGVLGLDASDPFLRD